MKLSEINEEILNDAQRHALVFHGLEYSGETAEAGILLGTNANAASRSQGAAKLYREGGVKKIIPSGQPEWDFPEGHFSEAEYMKLLMVERGVSPEDVILENQAQTTYENMTYSLRILKERPELLKDNKVVLITSGYHMYRSLLLAQHVFGDIRVIPCPVWEEDIRPENWMNSDYGRRRISNEVHFLISHAREGIIEDVDVAL